MSFYKKLFESLEKYIPPHKLLKWGLNYSPMYRKTTGKIVYISEDMHDAIVKIPHNWKNENYVGAIFGGSLFSATDPIGMMLIMQILGKKYVVWDKASSIRYRIPAYQSVYAHFHLSSADITEIKERVKNHNETDWVIKVPITNQDGDTLFTEIEKVIYVADKSYYKEKRKARKK